MMEFFWLKLLHYIIVLKLVKLDVITGEGMKVLLEKIIVDLKYLLCTDNSLCRVFIEFTSDLFYFSA